MMFATYDYIIAKKRLKSVNEFIELNYEDGEEIPPHIEAQKYIIEKEIEHYQPMFYVEMITTFVLVLVAIYILL